MISKMPVVISCEHASSTLPNNKLGLTNEQILACKDLVDYGVAHFFDICMQTFQCTGIKGTMSRLFIDLNRNRDDAELIRSSFSNTPIPGNKINDAEKDLRISQYHNPYHRDLRRLLNECLESHDKVFYLSLHSMAQNYYGEIRDMDVTLISLDEEQSFAERLRPELEKLGLDVAINKPEKFVKTMPRCPSAKYLEKFANTSFILELNDKHQENFSLMKEIAGVLKNSINNLLINIQPALSN